MHRQSPMSSYTTGMAKDSVSRRSLLKAAGSVGIAGRLPDTALAFQTTGQITHEVATGPTQEHTPKHAIKFAVIGLDHSHINGITDTIRRSGGELVSVHSINPQALAGFQKRYDGVRVARSEDEILNDSSIQVVCSAAIPDLRAPLAVRVMRHGKDFLSDKPAITTLEQLAEVRRTVQETGRIFGIMYGRLESRATMHAGALLKEGAIGRVVQTVQLAPHRVDENTRPEWFWDPVRYGGTLCDLGSHQADEFVYFTGSTTAEVTMSQVANMNYRHRPKFQDFGDMMVHGDGGLGYFRVDWFTPDGLGAFGDERTFILGTEGYIEMRKTIDIGGPPGGDHLLIVDRKSARYIDCKNLALPFGRQFVEDIVNRTQVAQNQAAALLATELVLKGQKNARIL
jgi:predicted dehydrogenase